MAESSRGSACDEEDGRSFMQCFFCGEAEEANAAAEVAVAEKSRRRKEQEEAYGEALRQKKERRDEIRRAYAAHQSRRPTPMFRNYPKHRGCGTSRFMPRRGVSSSRASSGGGGSTSVPEVGEEEETTGLEPFFFDEAVALAEHAAAEGRRKLEEEEARDEEMLRRRWRAHKSALDAIRGYDHKPTRRLARHLVP
nr:unnamed protein product [Digitaria exilis]